MKYLCLAVLVLALVLPTSAQAQEPVYVMIGASNASNGYAAAEIEALTGTSVLLCTKNGSGLVHWSPGSVLLKTCLFKAKNYHVVGVFFINGEYEAKRGTEWLRSFSRIVGYLRSQWGDVPVSFVEVHPQMPGYFVDQTRAQQEATTVACMVVPDDLYLPADNWHYLQPELETIGQRLVACVQ